MDLVVRKTPLYASLREHFGNWGGRHRELLLKKEKLFHLRAGVLTKHTFLLKKARYRNRSFPKKESGEGAGGGGGG